MRRRSNKTPLDSAAVPQTVEELIPELARRRGVDAAVRSDELERDRDIAAHDRDRADLAQQTRLAGMRRAEREEVALADAELARLYRHARAAGERIRIKSQIARSGEARALGLERLRALNLRVLVPVLIGFAAWSTTGVQEGAAVLMQVTRANPTWWALWILEPVLIGAVVWIIIARARLAACGGRLAQRAIVTMVGCLAASIALNLIAGATGHHPGNDWTLVATVIGAMIAHAIGPVGAAMTAHLIGLVDESISDADPWHERGPDGTPGKGKPVPLLTEMDLKLPQHTSVPDPVQDPPAAGGCMPERPAADPEAWITGQAQTAAARIEAWLADQDPPTEGGLTSTPPTPGTGGPQGARKTVPDGGGESLAEGSRTGSHFDSEQGERSGEPVSHVAGLTSAARARRAAGDETTRKIAEHMAAHPGDTVEQICAALSLSRATVMRHRAVLREAHGDG